MSHVAAAAAVLTEIACEARLTVADLVRDTVVVRRAVRGDDAAVVGAARRRVELAVVAGVRGVPEIVDMLAVRRGIQAKDGVGEHHAVG